MPNFETFRPLATWRGLYGCQQPGCMTERLRGRVGCANHVDALERKILAGEQPRCECGCRRVFHTRLAPIPDRSQRGPRVYEQMVPCSIPGCACVEYRPARIGAR